MRVTDSAIGIAIGSHETPDAQVDQRVRHDPRFHACFRRDQTPDLDGGAFDDGLIHQGIHFGIRRGEDRDGCHEEEQWSDEETGLDSRDGILPLVKVRRRAMEHRR